MNRRELLKTVTQCTALLLIKLGLNSEPEPMEPSSLEGYITDIDTSAYKEGTRLCLDSVVPGKLQADPFEELLSYQIGQEIVVRSFNDSGFDIPEGSSVMFTDVTEENFPRLRLCESDDIPDGYASESILANHLGYVTIEQNRDLHREPFSFRVP